MLFDGQHVRHLMLHTTYQRGWVMVKTSTKHYMFSGRPQDVSSNLCVTVMQCNSMRVDIVNQNVITTK